MSKLQATLDLIRVYKGKWPHNITSGVMFNWGHRVTIDDFMKYAQIVGPYNGTTT